MLRPFLRPILVATAAALAAGATHAEVAKVKTAEARTALPVTADANSPTLALKKFVFRANDEKIGVLQTGFFCGPAGDIKFSTNTINLLTKDAARMTRRELDAAGYPKPAVNESAFQTSTTPKAADYEIGVTLKEMQANACIRDKQTEGGVWVKMTWELFSPRLQKVVYSFTTEGSAQTNGMETVPFAEVASRAMAVALRNLMAERAFVDAALKPVEGASVAAAGSDAAAQKLRIAVRATSGQKIQDRVPQLQSAVVTLLSGTGSGSGFFINADGYVLTNHHVVGDARFIKVKLANGRELVGEVLRSDRSRDVALVKTEPVALAPLELASDESRTGEDVYAMGSPLGEQFASSLTRGVLSGVRTVEQHRWLQSDVRILPGSSGGPLLGAEGFVVGMTSRGIGAGMAGINLFIPIREAIDTLKIDFKE